MSGRNATDWLASKANYQNRLNALHTGANLSTMTTELESSISKYLASGGVSKGENQVLYADIVTKMNAINEIKNSYQTLQSDVNEYLKTSAKDASLSDLLAKNGVLQTTIQQLSKAKDEMKTDVESAVAREEQLRSRETDATRHDLFLFGRPIRRGMIPYLWVLGVLFIGIGLCIFYFSADALGIRSALYESSFIGILTYSVMDFFSNQTVLLAIIGALVITIIALGLKIAGVFG
jgi:hypothetical protein